MDALEANTSVAGSNEVGRQAWESCRRQMRQMVAENITNGVSRMRVASGEPNAEDSQRASDYESTDVICEDEAEDADDMEIRPLPVRGRGRGGVVHQEKFVFRGGRRSKCPPGEKAGKRPTEWKLQDLQKRLLEAGVERTVDGIGKKWDNLFQRYKKVQRYQNASRGKNFFNLAHALRTEEGFNFIMEERVYDEINAKSKGNKTIYPDNVADTSARGGLQMSRSPSVAGESVSGGDEGDGNDDDGGSARESGSLESVPNMVSAAVHGAASTGGGRREEGTHEEAGRKEQTTYRTPVATDDDDEPIAKRKKRLRQEDDLDAKSKQWTDRKTLWGAGLGRLIADAVHSCADYYCAIVNGDASASAPAGLIVPTNDVPRFRSEDPAQRDPTLRRVRRTENVAMRVIHGLNYNARLADPDVAARMNWLRKGPLVDETKDDGDNGDGGL
ncbi:hypothetical protein CBR_g21256 [Chara braunii]|uniref:Myb/SANT-like domain-containing protein n=1 Tax=Chara braunii TaxID=69332 RepID=A0A388L117_CHABU|nr:hypothetical protein CBR_g21256 [Chara braunii]|eukprot:GBG76016.1 hypothetical protein CBR_g21256 [Chara braunii]